MESRICASCNQDKPIAAFHTSGRWIRRKCRACESAAAVARNNSTPARKAAHLATTQKWRDRNRSRLRAQQRAKWLAGRFLNDMAKAAPCSDCGARLPAVCMDWDHRPDETKLRNVGNMVRAKPSVIFAEIAKCDLVCANCHRLRTHSREAEVCRGK